MSKYNDPFLFFNRSSNGTMKLIGLRQEAADQGYGFESVKKIYLENRNLLRYLPVGDIARTHTIREVLTMSKLSVIYCATLEGKLDVKLTSLVIQTVGVQVATLNSIEDILREEGLEPKDLTVANALNGVHVSLAPITWEKACDLIDIIRDDARVVLHFANTDLLNATL